MLDSFNSNSKTHTESTGPNTAGWQSAYETTPESLPGARTHSYRGFWAVMAVLVLPLAFAMEIIADSLADLNYLNSHKLLPLADQVGTLTMRELAMNASVWQGLIFGVMILSVPIFLWGFVVLAKQAQHEQD